MRLRSSAAQRLAAQLRPRADHPTTTGGRPRDTSGPAARRPTHAARHRPRPSAAAACSTALLCGASRISARTARPRQHGRHQRESPREDMRHRARAEPHRPLISQDHRARSTTRAFWRRANWRQAAMSSTSTSPSTSRACSAISLGAANSRASRARRPRAEGRPQHCSEFTVTRSETLVDNVFEGSDPRRASIDSRAVPRIRDSGAVERLGNELPAAACPAVSTAGRRRVNHRAAAAGGHPPPHATDRGRSAPLPCYAAPFSTADM
jgi:hypothetical protein